MMFFLSLHRGLISDETVESDEACVAKVLDLLNQNNPVHTRMTWIE